MKQTTVNLLLFDDVEVLDFAGPYEVLSVSRDSTGEPLFKVRTVALAVGPVRARNGLMVTPDHTLTTAPAADLLVIPGGYGTRALIDRPEVIDWIRWGAAQGAVVASVCTGSLLLAKAGLLAGLPATTHYQSFDRLRQLAPTATVREDVRFTDSGPILTAAGISAGIDLALHLVARYHGATAARQTAQYMEYTWRDDGGRQR